MDKLKRLLFVSVIVAFLLGSCKYVDPPFDICDHPIGETLTFWCGMRETFEYCSLCSGLQSDSAQCDKCRSLCEKYLVLECRHVSGYTMPSFSGPPITEEPLGVTVEPIPTRLPPTIAPITPTATRTRMPTQTQIRTPTRTPAPALLPVEVNAAHDSSAKAQPYQPIRLVFDWTAATDSQVRDYIESVTITITVNGHNYVVSGSSYFSPTKSVASCSAGGVTKSPCRVSHWAYDLSGLPAGNYQVKISWSLSKRITDGMGSQGPGSVYQNTIGLTVK